MSSMEMSFEEAIGVDVDYSGIENFGQFETMIVDADTLLFRASAILEENYVKVTHKKSGKTNEFANKTEFWGHWKKKEGGWLGERNQKRTEAGKDPISHEAFEVEELKRPNPEYKNHVAVGVKYFVNSIKALKKHGFAQDILILLGGGGNFRVDVAKTREYKGNRKPKPMFFEDVRKAVIKKMGQMIELVPDKEVDDRMGYYGMENLRHYKKTGVWKYLLSYVDKDLKMIESPYFNYDLEYPEIKVITRREAAIWYGMQLLMGDKSTDNIQGLPELTKEIKEKYELPNRKGVGEATTRKLLERCKKPSEVFSIVCECYKSYYGDEPQEFESWSGEKLKWNWKDYIQETAMLIFMNPLKNPMNYNVLDHFSKMGVNVNE